MLTRRTLIRIFMIVCVLLGAVSPTFLSYVLPNKGFNLLFGYILPLVLVLSPLWPMLARTVPLKGPRGPQQAARVRRLTRGLWIGTAVSVVGVATAQALATAAADLNMAVFLSLAVFFILQFLFAVPLIREKNPAIKPVFMPEIRRAASLAPRDAGMLPTWAWLLAWGVWIAVVIPCLLLVPTSGTPGAIRSDIVILLCGAAAPLAIAPFATQWWLQSPEPMDPAGTAELAETYRHLRSIKAWGIWAVAFVWTAIFCTHAILTAWRMNLAAWRVVSFPVLLAPLFWFQLTYYECRSKASKLLQALSHEPDTSRP